MTISKARSYPFGITGEEQKSVSQSYATINRDRIAQRLRALTNEVETDLAALHIYASRAYGTYNATPFGTAADLSDFAESTKLLNVNGAPNSDRHMVLGANAATNIRGKQSSLFKVNEAGSEELLRTGALGVVQGWSLHESAQVKAAVTVGTNNGSATTDATGYAVGTTSITMADAGTGTIIPGDIITFAGDTNKYLVVQGDSNVATGAGTLIIAEPGLRVAMSAATKTITTVAATTRNMFFHRSAIQLATRAPAMPEGGDAADDVMTITDPVSGIAYEFCIYKQKRQVRYEINLAWGVKMIMPRYCGVLIGA
jgi:hypothetical protein